MFDPSKSEKPNPLIESLLTLLPPQHRAWMRPTLTRNDTESMQLLTQLIAKQQQKRRDSRWTVPLLFVLILLIQGLASDADIDPLPWLIPGGSLFAFLFAARIYLPMRVEKAALNILWHCEGEQSLGPLLETLSLQPRGLRAKTKTRLVQLLPRLTLETFRRFPVPQRRALYALLNYAQRDRDLELRLAVLAALRAAGDRSCLGYIAMLAIGGATSYTARTVRDAASACLDHLIAHLDFGPLQDLPHHISSAYTQLQVAEPDLPLYFASVLTLRQLLPQLTPANYRDIVPEINRRQLYSISMLRVMGAGFKSEIRNLNKRDMQLEIVRTAERLGDVCAIPSFRSFVEYGPTGSKDDLSLAVRQALRTLEPLREREQMSRTLLRGTTAPDASPDELLRAVAPNLSATDPAELLRASTPQASAPSSVSTAAEQTVRLRAGTDEEV